MTQEETHFGFKTIPKSEKAERVAQVFHQVADRYDLMNDVMSLGTHRLMKRMAVEATRARPGDTVLDLAGGTGDLSMILADRVGETGTVLLCDINAAMLDVGRDRLVDQGRSDITFIQGDAECLPLADASLNAAIIGFGLRNVTDKDRALRAIRAALRPGARLVILEFSKLQIPALAPAYKAFSSVWPKVGQWLTGDAAPYQYLIESIEMHPDQETLAEMMREAGFVSVGYSNLGGGVAAMHYGESPISDSPATDQTTDSSRE